MMSIFSSIPNLIPLIVGTVFLSVALALHIDYMRFLRQGRKIRGRVKAIEKYRSTHREDGRDVSSTFYRPIVEYIYNGETHTVKGTGSNEMRYKLDQTVTVMVLPVKGEAKTQPLARIQDKSHRILSLVFCAFGLGGLAMYVLSAGGPVIGAALGLGVGLGLGIVLAAQMKKAEQVIGALRKTLDDHREELAEDSILIDTKAAYQKERARHHFWGHIIAYGFMAMSIGIMYLGYSDLPQAAQGLIMNDFSGFWSKMTSGSLPSSWEKSLILIGIGLVFFLASLHSVFHVQRKYGSPLRV